MILLVGFYLDSEPNRLREFLVCLEKNVANRAIDEIHVFVEQPADPPKLASSYPQLAAPKIRLIVRGMRLTFRALFEYANRELPGRRVMIANADMYFDHTLSRLDDHDISGRLVCLSRWDVRADGLWQLFDFAHSQDVWIFEPPIPIFESNFHLGIWGCDNRLAWEAEAAGLALCNPSRSVRAYHLHLSGIRRCPDTQRLQGGYLAVPSVRLEETGLPRRPPVSDPATLEPSSARVAFHETMGYAIERLDLGISSHTNESRPFTAIPSQLAGRRFTQVVAWAESAVTVEFLSAGRLFVLVGLDWHGYYPATAWIDQVGRLEPLPLVETSQRPAFEIWSITGRSGDRFVAPTQVMLVADDLQKVDDQGARQHESTQDPEKAATS